MRHTFLLVLFSISLALSSGSCRAQSGDKENAVSGTKGLLLHITHYDPKWVGNKESEPRFSLETGLELLDAMKKAGFNMVILDIADGVIYDSHPEMQRHYSVPISELKAFSDRAHELGIEFVPKLNFSRSGRNQHDKWLSPHWDQNNFVKVRDDYRQTATDIIDEIVELCQPIHFFHIGMDEDHHRSLSQYVETITFFHDYLEGKGIRTMVWNDTPYENRDVIAQVHADKMRAAEPLLPKDIIHVVWDYDLVHEGLVKRLSDYGFSVLVAPGGNPGRIKKWKKIMEEEGGDGFLFTNWTKCSDENRQKLLDQVESLKDVE